MNLTDPISDMLTRIRNATVVRHDSLLVPASKLKLVLAQLLKEEGFIADYELLRGKPQRMIKITLKYTRDKSPLLIGLKRVSRPGLRVYVAKNEIPRLYGGLGTAILSTSQGVMTGRKARKIGVGGEFLCYVW
ncbi:MAG: 30S ribosomal protein S8 [Chloroflexota bacterium]